MMTKMIKRRIKKALIFSMIGLLVSSYGSLFFLGNNAGAASPYDDIIQKVDKVETTCMATGENKKDWTHELGGFVLNTENYYESQENLVLWARALLQSQFNRGKGWFIQQHIGEGNKPTYVSLTVYDTTVVKPKFVNDTNYGFFGTATPHLRFDGAIYNQNYFSFRVVDYGYGTYGLSCGDYQLEMMADVNWYKDDQKFRPLFLNDDIEYPAGYEGDVMPDSVKPPLIDIQPEVIVKVDDLKFNGTLCTQLLKTDTNKKEICKKMVMPYGIDTRVRWEIKNNPSDAEPLISTGGALHKSLRFEHEFKEYGTYWLIVYYEDMPVPYATYEQQGYRRHVLNMPLVIDGSTYVSGSGKDQTNCVNGICGVPKQFVKPVCIKRDMPFVDPVGCVENAVLLLDDVTFNVANLRGLTNIQYSNGDTGCGNLNKLGDWLSLENKAVCPKVSADVRNTVTPFITGALSLAVIAGISRMYRGGGM